MAQEGLMEAGRGPLPSYGSQIEAENQRLIRGVSSVRGLAVSIKTKLLGQLTPSESKDESQVAREGFLTNHLDALQQSNSELELAIPILEEVLESLQ